MTPSILRARRIRQNQADMLDDPGLVRSEYEDPSRLETHGDLRARSETALETVAETHPVRVLDVGAGTGAFAVRVAAATGAVVTAVDSAPAMVAQARRAGVDAVLADARSLPFPDDSFDCVVANWMLYHVAGRDDALAEIARVLRPSGRLVAATFSERNLAELWDALGDDTPRAHGFTAENGAAQLRRRFGRVQQRVVAWRIEFADREALQALVEATIRRSHLATRVEHLALPFAATARHAVFVAVCERRPDRRAAQHPS
jgi:ubiquinone/menaquinone biosynthesis C-methylase UbiE